MSKKIMITLSDYGLQPMTKELRSLDEVKPLLKEYDWMYTRASVTSDSPRVFRAWRFLGERTWYSDDSELKLTEPSQGNSLDAWYEYEKGFSL